MKTPRTRMKGIVDPIALGFLLAVAGAAIGMGSEGRAPAADEAPSVQATPITPAATVVVATPAD